MCGMFAGVRRLPSRPVFCADAIIISNDPTLTLDSVRSILTRPSSPLPPSSFVAVGLLVHPRERHQRDETAPLQAQLQALLIRITALEDNTAPVITLTGGSSVSVNHVSVNQHSSYIDPGLINLF